MRIGVLGAGQMGSGIAQVAAQAGFSVQLVDASETSLTKARENIHKSLSKLADKKLISESADQVFSRIHFSQEMSSFVSAQVDLLIEAVSENWNLKQKLFSELDALLDPKIILCSNTSSISITKIAAATRRPERVMGMHFMNPVPLMTLVELITGIATSNETYEQVRSLAEKMGKTCIVSKDKAGFVINRILMPMINEAFFVLEEGMATASDIDTGMKLGTNQPMGPLTLADFIGLDTCLAIMEVLHTYLGDSKYRPSPLLRQYVEAGWLGKKVGRGVYTYQSK